MTIDEAIKILDTHHEAYYSFHSKEFWGSVQLGIEALKRLKELRTYPDHNPKWQLSGETEK